MEPHVFFAVMLAAALHAGWNAVAKVGGDPLIALTIISGFTGLVGACAIPVVGVPHADALGWLALSVVLHTGYRLFLAMAYAEGDLGQVYPLARGAAPLLVALLGLTAIGDPVGLAGLIGIAVLCAGIGIMTFRGGRLAAGLGLRASGFALATSVFIAGYTLVDGLGARASGAPLAYAAWLFFLDGIVMVAIAARARGRRLWSVAARHWTTGLPAGCMSAGAYGIAIWAMSVAPIALVAALRESSVLFAALISVAVLREPLTRWRITGAALILAGLAAIRVG